MIICCPSLENDRLTKSLIHKLLSLIETCFVSVSGRAFSDFGLRLVNADRNPVCSVISKEAQTNVGMYNYHAHNTYIKGFTSRVGKRGKMFKHMHYKISTWQYNNSKQPVLHNYTFLRTALHSCERAQLANSENVAQRI